ncbi:unnamed protein product [Amoebophrya sp. A120]|nr:unnamed protein product [Amoebophrya sp. A120]|eukprot:GSA120T00019173001.1
MTMMSSSSSSSALHQNYRVMQMNMNAMNNSKQHPSSSSSSSAAASSFLQQTQQVLRNNFGNKFKSRRGHQGLLKNSSKKTTYQANFGYDYLASAETLVIDPNDRELAKNENLNHKGLINDGWSSRPVPDVVLRKVYQMTTPPRDVPFPSSKTNTLLDDDDELLFAASEEQQTHGIKQATASHSNQSTPNATKTKRKMMKQTPGSKSMKRVVHGSTASQMNNSKAARIDDDLELDENGQLVRKGAAGAIEGEVDAEEDPDADETLVGDGAVTSKGSRTEKMSTCTATSRNAPTTSVDLSQHLFWRSRLLDGDNLCVSGLGSKYAMLRRFGRSCVKEIAFQTEGVVEHLLVDFENDNNTTGDEESNAHPAILKHLGEDVVQQWEREERDELMMIVDNGEDADHDVVMGEENDSDNGLLNPGRINTHFFQKYNHTRKFDYLVEVIGGWTTLLDSLEQAFQKIASQFLDNLVELADVNLLQSRTKDIQKMFHRAVHEANFDLKPVRKEWPSDYEYDTPEKLECRDYLKEQLQPFLEQAPVSSRTPTAPLHFVCNFFREFVEFAEVKILLVVHCYEKLVCPNSLYYQHANLVDGLMELVRPGADEEIFGSSAIGEEGRRGGDGHKKTSEDLPLPEDDPEQNDHTNCDNVTRPESDLQPLGFIRLVLSLNTPQNPFSTTDVNVLKLNHEIVNTYLPPVLEISPQERQYVEQVKRFGQAAQNSGGSTLSDFFLKCKACSRAFTSKHRAILKAVLEKMKHANPLGFLYNELLSEMQKNKGVQQSALDRILRELQEQQLIIQSNPEQTGQRVKLNCGTEYLKQKYEEMLELFSAGVDGDDGD